MSKILDFWAGMTGTVLPYALSAPPDSGWLLCDGAVLTASTPHQRLRQKLIADGFKFGKDGSGNPKLPDLRGEFIRGFDSGRGVDAGRGFGSDQEHMTASHTHTASSGSSGAHAHTASAASAGAHTHTVSGTTNTTGSHQHDGVAAQPGTGGQLSGGGVVYHGMTQAAGDHSHTVSGTAASAGAHAHTITVDSGGAHTHSVTVQAAGGTETRPRNVAMNFIIKT